MLTELALPYADTSAAALHWSPAPPATPSLDVLVLGDDDARLQLHLLGASHSAVLTLPGGEVVETVACPTHGAAGDPLPARRELVVSGARYRFTSSVDRLVPQALRDLAAGLREDVRVRSDRLAGVFPGDSDALTVLAGRARPHSARWVTWHLYPNTGEAVRTATEVRW